MRRLVKALVVAAATTLALVSILSGVSSSAQRGKAGLGSVTSGTAKGETYQVARLTGPGSINHTDVRWNVYGTDLGHMFEHHDRIYMVFGDTFGSPGEPPSFGSDWRSNALAWLSESDPTDGLRFDGMVTDDEGAAKEILASKHGSGGELTVIPTNGVSDGARMFLHFMSVREFGPPGQWSLNYSGLAYSDDDGRTWTKSSDAVWPGDSNFGQVAFVERDQHVYLFGIPGGRFGHAELARVAKHELLELERYEYWNGSRWTRDSDGAAIVVPAPVGELSVQWNSHYRKWLMMYLNDDDSVNAVVVRTADCLTGPWSNERLVVSAEEVPQLYAPYIAPRWNDLPDIYFTLSRFDLYDVFWWHTSLNGQARGDAEAQCVSP